MLTASTTAFSAARVRVYRRRFCEQRMVSSAPPDLLRAVPPVRGRRCSTAAPGGARRLNQLKCTKQGGFRMVAQAVGGVQWLPGRRCWQLWRQTFIDR